MTLYAADMDVGPPRSAPQPDEAFTRLLSIVLSPGSPIYDTSVPKRRVARTNVGKPVEKFGRVHTSSVEKVRLCVGTIYRVI